MACRPARPPVRPGSGAAARRHSTKRSGSTGRGRWLKQRAGRRDRSLPRSRTVVALLGVAGQRQLGAESTGLFGLFGPQLLVLAPVPGLGPERGGGLPVALVGARLD